MARYGLHKPQKAVIAQYLSPARHSKCSTFWLVLNNIWSVKHILFVLAGRAKGSFAHNVVQS